MHAHYVTPTLGFHPSTWRLSCRNPNLQTIPKRNDLAKEFRKMIVASPGCELIEFDSSGIEAVLVGWLAESTRYIRLAKAGIHGWLLSHLLGQPIDLALPDADLAAACKAMKKSDPHNYDVCKRVIHLSGYMGTPERIAEEYPDQFPDIEVRGPRGGMRIVPGSVEAKRIQDALFDTEPGKDVQAWHKRVLERVHKEKVVKTPFGVWMYFYDVFTYNRKSAGWSLGDDAKRCVAAGPQSMAASIQRKIIRTLRGEAPWVLEHFRLPVHDALIFDMPKPLVQRACPIIYRAFTQPWKELPLPDGSLLSIGAEGSVGQNLGEMRTLTEEELSA